MLGSVEIYINLYFLGKMFKYVTISKRIRNR